MVFPEIASSVLFLGPLRLYLFGLFFDRYDEALGLGWLNFVFIICFHHGFGLLFFSVYWR